MKALPILYQLKALWRLRDVLNRNSENVSIIWDRKFQITLNNNNIQLEMMTICLMIQYDGSWISKWLLFQTGNKERPMKYQQLMMDWRN